MNVVTAPNIKGMILVLGFKGIVISPRTKARMWKLKIAIGRYEMTMEELTSGQSY
jgi:hypothetical protein